MRYIRTNNPLSAYALHILQNRHEYGTIADILQLLKTCRKDTRMNCWEVLYIRVFHQNKVLITEQHISDTNPLYELACTTRILPRNPQPVSHYVTHDVHHSQAHSQQRTIRQHGKHGPSFNPNSLINCIYMYIYKHFN